MRFAIRRAKGGGSPRGRKDPGVPGAVFHRMPCPKWEDEDDGPFGYWTIETDNLVSLAEAVGDDLILKRDAWDSWLEDLGAPDCERGTPGIVIYDDYVE